MTTRYNSEAQAWRGAMPERNVDTHGVSDAGANGVLTNCQQRASSEAQLRRGAVTERNVDTHGVSDAGANGVLTK